uniref:Uncharacterized protein n=1 Tax=Eutreptiella gymnastica TaxID=73025 RepID=A0A7S1JJK3_9EUGL|mmetsp:Transcript_99484/g.171256  ORF Transcript_99484/g.171256 Transcript_99484/m.171256 type:complete len:100 (+) Transcript_99484:273-572(+)
MVAHLGQVGGGRGQKVATMGGFRFSRPWSACRDTKGRGAGLSSAFPTPRASWERGLGQGQTALLPPSEDYTYFLVLKSVKTQEWPSSSRKSLPAPVWSE